MEDRNRRLKMRSQRSEEYLRKIPLNRLGPAGRILVANPRPPDKNEVQKVTSEHDEKYDTQQLPFSDN